MPEKSNAARSTQASPNIIAVRREYGRNGRPDKQGAHWHSNASELVYCISGSGSVQIGLPSARGPAGRVDGGGEMIAIGPDESAFVPLGYPHDIIAGPEGIEVMIIFDAGNANTFEQEYVFPVQKHIFPASASVDSEE